MDNHAQPRVTTHSPVHPRTATHIFAQPRTASGNHAQPVILAQPRTSSYSHAHPRIATHILAYPRTGSRNHAQPRTYSHSHAHTRTAHTHTCIATHSHAHPRTAIHCRADAVQLYYSTTASPSLYLHHSRSTIATPLLPRHHCHATTRAREPINSSSSCRGHQWAQTHTTAINNALITELTQCITAAETHIIVTKSQFTLNSVHHIHAFITQICCLEKSIY